MKTITEYREEIKDLMADLDAQRTRCVQDNRDPSPEERSWAIERLARVDELEQIIDLEMRAEATRNRLAQPQSPPNKPNPGGGNVEPDNRPQDKFQTFGEFLIAATRAFQPGGYKDPRLKWSGPIGPQAATGLSEGTPSDGGFLVQQDFVQELLARSYEQAVVASKCRRLTVSANSNGLKIPGIDETSRVDGSRWGGVQAYWTGEAASKTASTPSFRMVELNLNKLTGLCYATDELLQDANALESYIRMAFTDEFAFKVDDAIINGTGAGMPLGIYNSPCLVSVSKEAGQDADTIKAENIYNMYSRLWAKSLTNAVWLIHQDCYPQIFQLSLTHGTSGTALFVPPGGISAGPYGTLMGRPVFPIEQCQTIGDKGDIYFADFSQYLLIDKGAMESAMSIHVKFTADETVYRFVYRCDGQPLWNSTLTPFKGSNTLSPFVTLNARA